MAQSQHNTADLLFKWAIEDIATQQGKSVNSYIADNSRAGWDLDQFSNDLIRAQKAKEAIQRTVA